MKKTGILFLVFLALLMICVSRYSSDDVPKTAEDEIRLVIRLDLKEDIGLLILDCDLNGTETSGGVSNADKSLLKRDEVLYWSLSKQEYGYVEGPVDLTVRFRVITEYCDPNYENDYPEEYTVLLDPLALDADFGKDCHITISGDKENGYQAVQDLS